jgi:CheY-like chemotaxis protein
MNKTNLDGLRVLVVEDEMLVCMDIEDVLGELGCTVVGPASTIDRALEIIDEELFDVAMLDLNLSGEPSYPIAKRLAERGVPFLLATGYAEVDPAFADRPRIQKPFMTEGLRDKLLIAIGRSEHA